MGVLSGGLRLGWRIGELDLRGTCVCWRLQRLCCAPIQLQFPLPLPLPLPPPLSEGQGERGSCWIPCRGRGHLGFVYQAVSPCGKLVGRSLLTSLKLTNNGEAYRARVEIGEEGDRKGGV